MKLNGKLNGVRLHLIFARFVARKIFQRKIKWSLTPFNLPFNFLIALLLQSCALTAYAQESAKLETDHLHSQLLSSQSQVAAGQPFWVGLRFQHEEKWHTYWRVSGDSGLPTQITWSLPPGWTASPIQWPLPQRKAYGAELMNFVVPQDTILLTQITPPKNATADAVTLTAQARWLICADVCIPGSGSYTLTLNVGATAQPSLWQNRLQRAQEGLPRALSGWRVDAQWHTASVAVQLQPQQGQALPAALEYFPHQPDLIANAKPQSWVVKNGAGTLTIPAADNKTRWDTLDGLLVADGGAWAATVVAPIRGARAVANTASLTLAPSPKVESATQANSTLPPRTDSPAEVKPSSWLTALLGAFLGGLILNLMPCVFPVLSIKVVAMVQHEARHPGVLHKHGLIYAAGVLLGFLALAGALLAVRAAGSTLGWGFQLQNPWFVFALAILFTLIALNLFGVFEIRWGQTRAAQAEHDAQQLHPHLSAFATGLLAVVVASPCSAPFMGAALGFALTQPAVLALLIFAALGLGLAFPYVLLCYWPALLQRLPRSGAWMNHFKHLLAFPMLATVAWLLWVYGLQTSADRQFSALLVLCALGLACWLWGTIQRTTRPSRAWWALVAVALALLAYAGQRSASNPSDETGHWKPWSEAAMQTALAQNKTVFVDFTAAWCVTCQLNKKAVLETEQVQQALVQSGIVLLRADWTRPNPEIAAALQKLGRNGIPVYWLQRPGRPPVLLPEVLTRAILLSALRADSP
ncbi:MAG: DUF255 domain-containing protein [Burkholderiaceae bacterium]|nr:MAG: DUF255 domain-containing protein [Burkholderiaceae bacterium]